MSRGRGGGPMKMAVSAPVDPRDEMLPDRRTPRVPLDESDVPLE